MTHFRFHYSSSIIELAEVCRRCGMTEAQIALAIIEKRFPLPSTGEGIPKWIRSEVEEFLGKRWIAKC